VAEEKMIRKISADGVVATLTGSHVEGNADGPGHEARFSHIWGMAITPGASGTLVVCDIGNGLLRRVDPNNDRQVTTIKVPVRGTQYFRRFELADVACSSDRILYVVTSGCLLGIDRAGAFPLILRGGAPARREFTRCHLDEPNDLVYVTNGQEIYTASVPAVKELRAMHIFPFVRMWALALRDRAELAPASGVISGHEASAREALSRLMRLRVVGVVGRILRFAFS
jgi:hypothetical protein